MPSATHKILTQKPTPFLIISILILLASLFTGCVSLDKPAYIPSVQLPSTWYENKALHETGTTSYGMETWETITYETHGSYPASLSITTIKTWMLMDEEDLFHRTNTTILTTLNDYLEINISSQQHGERQLENNHQTKYITYRAIDPSKKPAEQMRIIGELWNCGTSGASIICIGISYITNTTNNITLTNTSNWDTIIQDPTGSISESPQENGLIYQIVCHD